MVSKVCSFLTEPQIIIKITFSSFILPARILVCICDPLPHPHPTWHVMSLMSFNFSVCFDFFMYSDVKNDFAPFLISYSFAYFSHTTLEKDYTSKY